MPRRGRATDGRQPPHRTNALRHRHRPALFERCRVCVVKRLGQDLEARARPAPHAAPASRLITPVSGPIQRLVQLDQAQPRLGEAQQLPAGVSEEGEVIDGEPGRDWNHPIAVDQPDIVAARLEPADSALGAEPHRLKALPKPGAGPDAYKDPRQIGRWVGPNPLKWAISWLIKAPHFGVYSSG